MDLKNRVAENLRINRCQIEKQCGYAQDSNRN